MCVRRLDVSMKHEVCIMALFTPEVNSLSPNFKDQLGLLVQEGVCWTSEVA